MLSLEYEISVPGFAVNEIGYQTLVRSKPADMQIKITNDGQNHLYKITIKPVIESYVGQDKPILFFQGSAQTIEQIPTKAMIPLTFRIWPLQSGLVSIAVYVTDETNNAVMVKRQNEQSYSRLPVRWWFHVADNIAVETLRTLKAVLAQNQTNAERPKLKSLKKVIK